MIVQYPMLSAVSVSHPDVASCEVSIVEGGVIAAVMLRPLYGRSERQRVLREIALALRDTLASYSSTSESAAECANLPVYVVADVDVYQALLHGDNVPLSLVKDRRGCYRLGAE